uniref:uncharacterized protein LOC120342845 n=1 Tax=Styela clava TaxID=7725 RepID=UPI00193A27A8|nr:uncharacterized protein LOC120342845 [Styela clava]
MVIRIYWASVTGNRKINSDQSRLKNVLECFKLESTWIDVTTSRSVMNQMRMECGKANALPPQIFNDDVYLGDVDDFNERIEDGSWKAWIAGNADSTDINLDAPEENISCNQNNSNNEYSTNQVADESVPKYTPSEEIKITSSTSVSSAVSNFENINKSPKVSRKVVQIQFASNSEEQNTEKSKMDDERRRRILGLAPAEENGEVKCLQDKTNETTHETNGVKDIESAKIKSIYEAEKETS